MNHWLRFLVFALLMVLKGTVTMNAASIEFEDNVNTFELDSHNKQQAIVNDSSLIYRICSSRPARVIIIQNLARQIQKQCRRLQLFYHNSKIQRHFRTPNHVWGYRLMLLPSCEYYVFTLRRILC